MRSLVSMAGFRVCRDEEFGFEEEFGSLLVEKFDIEPFSQPNHQTLEGSFSAVSTPNFATKASFFSIFRDLQDLQSFAPLRSPKFSKKLQKICRFSNGSNGSIVRRSNLST